MEKAAAARRIWDICQQEKGLKDEKEELRADLFKRMKTNEILYFDTPVGVHRAKRTATEVTYMKSPKEIAELYGAELVLECVKLCNEKLKEVLDGMEYELCIKGKGPGEDVLKILKGRG